MLVAKSSARVLSFSGTPFANNRSGLATDGLLGRRTRLLQFRRSSSYGAVKQPNQPPRFRVPVLDNTIWMTE